MHFVCVFNILSLPTLFTFARNRFEGEAAVVPINLIVLGRVIELNQLTRFYLLFIGLLGWFLPRCLAPGFRTSRAIDDGLFASEALVGC